MLTLSSDFGSPYPAAMKGVVRRVTDAELVDVAHDLPRQDVRASAFWLDQVLPSFPPAVHLAVVDPGVGTSRAAIVVRAGGHALVGPDNGVLLPVARTLSADTGAIESDDADDADVAGEADIADEADVADDAGDLDIFEVAVVGEGDPEAAGDTTPATDWPPDPASSTFHGRDVFAPAAARVHEVGVDAVETLQGVDPTDEYEDLRLPEPTIREDGAVGTVLAVDGFGNVITNVPGSVVAEQFGDHVKANGVWAAARRTYADVDEGHRVVTVGSHGNVELAVNQGRGDDTFGVTSGGRIRLSW
jgi:S-adenosylmethionine hydrolase